MDMRKIICIYIFLLLLLCSEPVPWGWTAANLLLFKKVREGLGFQRCKIFAVGAAPTRMETYEYFMSVNITLMNFYGKKRCVNVYILRSYKSKVFMTLIRVGRLYK